MKHYVTWAETDTRQGVRQAILTSERPCFIYCSLQQLHTYVQCSTYVGVGDHSIWRVRTLRGYYCLPCVCYSHGIAITFIRRLWLLLMLLSFLLYFDCGCRSCCCILAECGFWILLMCCYSCCFLIVCRYVLYSYAVIVIAITATVSFVVHWLWSLLMLLLSLLCWLALTCLSSVYIYDTAQ